MILKFFILGETDHNKYYFLWDFFSVAKSLKSLISPALFSIIIFLNHLARVNVPAYSKFQVCLVRTPIATYVISTC